MEEEKNKKGKMLW